MKASGDKTKCTVGENYSTREENSLIKGTGNKTNFTALEKFITITQFT